MNTTSTVRQLLVGHRLVDLRMTTAGCSCGAVYSGVGSGDLRAQHALHKAGLPKAPVVVESAAPVEPVVEPSAVVPLKGKSRKAKSAPIVAELPAAAAAMPSKAKRASKSRSAKARAAGVEAAAAKVAASTVSK